MVRFFPGYNVYLLYLHALERSIGDTAGTDMGTNPFWAFKFTDSLLVLVIRQHQYRFWMEVWSKVVGPNFNLVLQAIIGTRTELLG